MFIYPVHLHWMLNSPDFKKYNLEKLKKVLVISETPYPDDVSDLLLYIYFTVTSTIKGVKGSYCYHESTCKGKKYAVSIEIIGTRTDCLNC
jgi:hypothetical protein